MEQFNNHTWTEYGRKLRVRYEFADFSSAISFVLAVGRISELANHHPEINIVYNRVDLALCTYDEGSKVTIKDHDLACQIEKLYFPYFKLRGKITL
jgi:4a-hydroxytetrahydrobiopterin dehydratase